MAFRLGALSVLASILYLWQPFGLGVISVLAAFYLWRAFSLAVIRARLRADCCVDSFDIEAPLTPFTAHIALHGRAEYEHGLLHRQDSITAAFPMFAFYWTRIVKAQPQPVSPEEGAPP